MAKYCISCGSVLSPDDVFCGNCGERALVDEKPVETRRAAPVPEKVPDIEIEEGSTEIWVPDYSREEEPAPSKKIQEQGGFAAKDDVGGRRDGDFEQKEHAARHALERNADKPHFEPGSKEQGAGELARAGVDASDPLVTTADERHEIPVKAIEGARPEEPPNTSVSSEADSTDEEDYEPTLVFTREKYFLIRKADDKKYELSFPCVVGRGSACEVRILGDRTISRKHARFSSEGDKVFIEDLSSTNSTLVDGITVSEGTKMVLKDGCSICLGDVDLVFAKSAV